MSLGTMQGAGSCNTSVPVSGHYGLGDYLRLGGGSQGTGAPMATGSRYGLGHDLDDISYEPVIFLGGRVVSAVAFWALARKFGKKGKAGHTNALVWGAVGGILNPLSLISRVMRSA